MDDLPDHIVFYDGACGFCHAIVRRLARIDRRRLLRYAPSAGETARIAANMITGFPTDAGRVVFLTRSARNGSRQFMCHQGSTAVFQILRVIGGIWSIPAALRFLPMFIRETVYRFIARRRQTWFGAAQGCPLHGPEYQELFLP